MLRKIHNMYPNFAQLPAQVRQWNHYYKYSVVNVNYEIDRGKEHLKLTFE